ncbi:SCO family protein [Aureimonas ureilytica]|uniref:SCO family protein n=1 Tax=Aureimonas ureilytica TaxID=401562 RepID=UPI000734C0F6|nr:SCO family protein [Aureimonas ureilytica]
MKPCCRTLRTIARALAPLVAVLGLWAALPAAAAGLVDQTGRAFDEAALGGGWHLVYFGYTNCPDICPTSLFEMTAALDLLPEASRAEITPVFITLDPARDTAEVMARYVQPLGHGFVTVSGDETSVDRFAFRHRIVAVRNVHQGANYSVDHTSSVLLFGPDGREVERFPYEMDFHEVARRMAAHMAAAPARAPGG